MSEYIPRVGRHYGVGTRVRVIGGPLEGCFGTVVDSDGRHAISSNPILVAVPPLAHPHQWISPHNLEPAP